MVGKRLHKQLRKAARELARMGNTTASSPRLSRGKLWPLAQIASQAAHLRYEHYHIYLLMG